MSFNEKLLHSLWSVALAEILFGSVNESNMGKNVMMTSNISHLDSHFVRILQGILIIFFIHELHIDSCSHSVSLEVESDVI